MLLRFILGEAGSGKSYRIREEFLQNIEKRPILIVPEQITLLEQKRLVSEQAGRGLLGADVLSFRRLAHRILAEKGEKDLVVLDEVGKSMLLYRLVQELSPDLVYYGKSVHSQGFLQRLKTLFSELDQYGVTNQALMEAAENAKEGSSLQMKLSDLWKIRARFEEAMLQHGEAAERLLDRLADAILQSERLAGVPIYVDDFYGFTPQQIRVLRQLMLRTEQLTIGITISQRAAEQAEWGQEEGEELFDVSRRTLHALYEEAKAYRVPVQKTFLAPRRQDGIAHTARQLFQVPPRPWKQGHSHVYLYAAPHRREEVRRVFTEILRLVRDEGYSYRQIGIALGDVAAYQELIRQYAEEFNMPVFMDETHAIKAHPFIRMILSLLQMIRSRCSYDTLFSFLKTGFTPFRREQLDTVDNLALARGWRGFERAREALLESTAGSPNEEAVKLYIQRLSEFWQGAESHKEAEAGWWCGHLQDFLVSTGAKILLEEQSRALEKEGFYVQASQNRQIYEAVCQVLGRIQEMMGDLPLDVDGFSGILTAGIGEIRLGMLPPTPDAITVGDMDRSRFREIRALFLVGFGEAYFPKVTQDQGLLQERERDTLPFQLAPGGLRHIYEQEFHLYMLLHRPEEALYISYDASPERGEPRRPSLYWSRLQQILGSESSWPREDPLTLAEPMFQKMLEQGGKTSDVSSWFLQHGYRERIRRLQMGGRMGEEALSPQMARRLWQPEQWELSVTRMERYARCPYSHFLQYGLRLAERATFRVSPMDDGRLLHGILEGAGMLLQQFFDMDTREEQIAESVRELFAKNEENFAQYQDNGRYRFYWRKLQKTAVRALGTLKTQVEMGTFRPEYFEWGFGSGAGKSLPAVEVPLSEGQTLRIRGIVDRVDILREEDQTYIRILDYKSGNAKFDEKDMQDGIGLQLPVYLKAVSEGMRAMGQEVVPAGMFYFHLIPSVEKVKDTENTPEKIEKKIKDQVRLNGVLSSDPKVISGMAKEKKQINELLPVRITNSGAIHASDKGKLRTAEELQALGEFAIRKIGKLAEEELSGCIYPFPYQNGQYPHCYYCDYRDICSFDIRQKGAKIHWASKMSREEFWKQVQEET